MTKPGRIPCEVLGCRRTAPAENHESGARICCGKCWRLGAPEDHKAYAAADKLLRRFDGLSDAESAALDPETLQALADAETQAHRAWQAVIRTASEARAGIA